MSSILNHFPGEPRPQQVKALLEIEKHWDDADIFIVQAPVACHALGQLVWMCDGTKKKIEDVCVGDKLVGPDGTPRTVTHTHNGTGQLYGVSGRGFYFKVTGDHILPLKKWHRTQQDNTRTSSRIDVQQSVSDWVLSSKENKLNTYLYSNMTELFTADNCTWDSSISPYLLGVWLGDGTAKEASITNIEPEVINEWETLQFDGLEHAHTGKFRHTIRRTTSSRNLAITELKKLVHLDGTKTLKFNPLHYSPLVRREILAGLIDTDGYVHDCSCDIVQVRLDLAMLAFELAASLGYATSKPKAITKRCQTGATGVYWNTSFSVPSSLTVPNTRVKRKQLVNVHNRDTRLRRFTIEEVGIGDWAGVTVDGDNLYLMDNFIVTHNCGKSRIAVTLSRWMFKEKHARSNIIVPTNVLLQQYRQEFPKLNSIQRKDLYRCKNVLETTDLDEGNCDYVSKLRGEGGKPEYCPDCCYLKAVRLAHKSPYMVANYWSYMALKLFKPVVIIDEAHNLTHVIRDLEGKRLWRKDYGYPTNVTNYQQLLDWVTKHHRLATDKKLQLLKDELENGRQRYLVEKGFDLFRNEEQECLKLLPLDISNAKPYLWPQKKVQKIIMMSATFSEVDLESLGLTGRRVLMINTDSPIPVERRPVVFKPIVNTSFAFQDVAVVKLAQFIKETADANPSVLGFVHCTYSFANKLQKHLVGSRFIFHDSCDKMDKYRKWLASDCNTGAVFIGCGLDEGIDLKGPKYGWQIVAKAQYANLSEPAVKYQAENNPKEYVWDAMRKCAQSCGRICRSTDDYGITYLVDTTFKKLFKQSKSYGIVPEWLTEQLVNKDELYE